MTLAPASGNAVSFGRRMTDLTLAHPDTVAITFVPDGTGAPESVPWGELERRSNQVARLLEAESVGQRSTVVIGLENCVEHYVAAHAAWRLGALVLPVSHRAPEAERNEILTLAKPAMVIANWGRCADFPTMSSQELSQAWSLSAVPLPDRTPNPGKAVCSGGGSGKPKIIVTPGPLAFAPGQIEARLNPMTGFRRGQVQMITGPLYHNAPFIWGHFGLFEDQSLVVFQRFDAAVVVDAIERYRINFGFLSPTMMLRIIRLPNIEERDFSSIDSIFHSGAACPEWVKRAWLHLLGPERVWEGFGSTEDEGTVWIRGDEWLQHPGAVGKPHNCDVRILDEQRHDLPAGVVGDIFTRPRGTSKPTYYYIGSPPAETTDDGFVSVGDLGSLDDEGYLHVADRRVDLIVTGGANVFPAEVEAALSAHSSVRDVGVIGLADSDWGKRVHAIVQPVDPSHPPSVEDLNVYVRQRLSSYKVPKSYEFVSELPRDLSGKLRRSALVAQREGDVRSSPVLAQPRLSGHSEPLSH